MNLDYSARTWTITGEWKKEPVDVQSDLFQDSYLPILGPSLVCLLRDCAKQVATDFDFRIEPCELAYQIGSGQKQGQHRLQGIIDRGTRFGWITITSPESFTVVLDAPLAPSNEKRRAQMRRAWNGIEDLSRGAVER